MVDPNKTFFLADRNTWHQTTKQIDSMPVLHVATQVSRRSRRKRTVHVWYIKGTGIVVYNRSRHGVYFMKMAIRPENMQNYFNTFVKAPQTPKELEWLKRHDYVLD
jgi:hypothetical protein